MTENFYQMNTYLGLTQIMHLQLLFLGIRAIRVKIGHEFPRIITIFFAYGLITNILALLEA